MKIAKTRGEPATRRRTRVPPAGPAEQLILLILKVRAERGRKALIAIADRLARTGGDPRLVAILRKLGRARRTGGRR